MILKIDHNQNADNIIQKIQSENNNTILNFNIKRNDKDAYIIIDGDIEALKKNYLNNLSGCSIVMDPFKDTYYFSSKKYKEKTIIDIDGKKIGDGNLSIIAGPCAIEDYQSLYQTALELKKIGVTIFRGMVKKPRTSPYSYQGIGKKGIEYLRQIKKELDMPVLTEILSEADLSDVIDDIDVLQIGSRNMQNYELIKAVAQTKKPILLKKGYWCNNEQLLKAAEYISICGNDNVIMCERGIQTHENMTRNTLDLSAIPILKDISHFPILIDPSHGTGRRELVIPMSKAAVLLGADSLEVEVHINPDKTIKPGDGYQMLDINQYKSLINELKPIMELRKIHLVK